MVDKGVCDKGFIWNLSNYECQCDKPCDIGEYLDYENCKCRKKLVDQLVGECTETVEEVRLAKIILAEDEISINAVLANCILLYVQHCLQLTLELVLCLFSLAHEKRCNSR